MTARDETPSEAPITDRLRSVLCGPDDKCCIHGSAADLEIIDSALLDVASTERELDAIRKEAETNQKWAFLEWRTRAINAERDRELLRETLQEGLEIDDPEALHLWQDRARAALCPAAKEKE